VLDNALDEAQLRPLLPGGGQCLVLVTSRRRLKGLDAHTLSLDLLPPPAALDLLRTAAGRTGTADGRPLAELAERCGFLPLALRIAGALLRHRPAWQPEHLIGLLREHRTLSDGERDLAAVFDLSYAGLTGWHRTLFRRLGLVPGPDVDARAAAALLDTDPATATAALEDLVDHNLLTCPATGRYRLHDLVRAHARTLAATDPPAVREAGAARLRSLCTPTAPAPRRPEPAAEPPQPRAAAR
jgi:hypothetical protein